MYIPQHYEESDRAVLHALIRAHPLGAWATLGDGELVVNHVPFLLDPSQGEFGVLVGHVARANSAWQSFSNTVPSVVLFQGPESYITPSWYPSKHAHGRAVPTWNYAVVHAHGFPRAIEDKGWLRHHLDELTHVHEARQALPWKVSDAPADYVDRMIEHIVGIEIPITKLVGKWKMSQNRSEADRRGVVAGLLAQDAPQARDMAALIDEKISRLERRTE